MLQFEKLPEETLRSHIEEFRNRKLFNNYYGIELKDVDCLRTKESLLLRKKYVGFYRVYILSDNEEDLIPLFSEMEENHAINIPSKGEIPLWKSLMEKTGFKSLGVYERFYNTNIESTGTVVDCFAVDSEFESIKNMIYAHFSPITDYLPNDLELKEMIRNQQVLVNRTDGEVTGILTYVLENKISYFHLWVDVTGNGITLLLSVYSLVAMKGIKYIYLWVRESNKRSSSIHLAMGAKRDGLKDYTFIKN